MDLVTLSQLQANYKLDGKTEFQGLPISIENRKGSTRKGKCEKGKPWSCWKTKMSAHYGYIRGVPGVDGDALDCFIGPNAKAKTAFVVHTLKAPEFKKHDEDKVMLGWNSAAAAKKALIANYGGDARHFGSMDAIPFEEFKQRVTHENFHPQKLTASRQEHAMEVEKVKANIGEPGVYEGGMSHLESTPTFHPPSLKKAKRVPADQPGETDNQFLDVTKRDSKATKRMRDERTRRVAVPTQLPGGNTAVQHHTAVNIPWAPTQ
jgi:hypothetical protein